MILYARIQNPEGQFDGLNGWVNQIVAFEDDAALLAAVGPEVIHEFVVAPNGYCIGWRYSEGAFLNPEEQLVESEAV
jgi:hypothetical protein